MTTHGQGVERLARCGNLYDETGVTSEGAARCSDKGYARSVHLPTQTQTQTQIFLKLKGPIATEPSNIRDKFVRDVISDT